MRRALPVLILGALLAAAVATGSTAGARTAACPTTPGPYSTTDPHIFQFVAFGVTLDRLSDARGNSARFVGSDAAIGRLPPGWSDNSIFNSTAGGTEIESDIIFDPGHPNTYAAHGHLAKWYPTEFKVRRYTSSSMEVDGMATWMLMSEPASNYTLVFGNGHALSSLRLCLDWYRNGTTDDDIAPLGWVEGPAANDEMPPRITARVLRVDATTATIALRATDTGSPRASGVAGIGWVDQNSGSSSTTFYKGPIRVPRTAKLAVWAIDRAGNDTSMDVDVATLVH